MVAIIGLIIFNNLIWGVIVLFVLSLNLRRPLTKIFHEDEDQTVDGMLAGMEEPTGEALIDHLNKTVNKPIKKSIISKFFNSEDTKLPIN